MRSAVTIVWLQKIDVTERAESCTVMPAVLHVRLLFVDLKFKESALDEMFDIVRNFLTQGNFLVLNIDGVEVTVDAILLFSKEEEGDIIHVFSISKYNRIPKIESPVTFKDTIYLVRDVCGKEDTIEVTIFAPKELVDDKV